MATRKPPSGTLVLLVRHGTTPTTGRVLPGRSAGLHLADSGREQAAQVAGRLGSLTVSAIYTSPLERACETAAPTADATGLAPVIEPGLAECNTGDWTGESLSTLARRPEWRTLATTPSTFRFPGGESFAELQARVVAVLDRLNAEHRGQVVACFTHADPVKVALAYALGAHLDAFPRISISTGSISAIRFTHGSPPVVPAVNSLQGPLTYLTTES